MEVEPLGVVRANWVLWDASVMRNFSTRASKAPRTKKSGELGLQGLLIDQSEELEWVHSKTSSQGHACIV